MYQIEAKNLNIFRTQKFVLKYDPSQGFLDRHSKKLNVIFITKPLSNVISKYMVVTLFSLHLKQISKYLPGE